MLKKRSRASGCKQGLMSEYPSPSERYNRPAKSIFPSPRLFVGLSAKGFSETEAVMSPTSTLETKPFSNHLFGDRNTWKPMPESGLLSSEDKRHLRWENGDYGPIGLGIVDALKEGARNSQSLKHENRKVLFGSQMKIEIPTILPIEVSPIGSVESPHSPIEFGIKTMNSVLGSKSPSGKPPTINLGTGAVAYPSVFTGTIPASEMELSEDYTCVIMHGPNPRTTHIFDNCIVESCGDWFQTSRVESRLTADRLGYPSETFLSFCHACKKDLRQGRDIYMYRGEKAFCSSECRCQEMLIDEGT